MKLKTTARDLRNYYGKYNAIWFGYCDAWHLLKGAGLEPFAYTSGVYGWNFDAYDLDGVLITTGYRGMIGKRAEAGDYEKKARAMMEKYGLNITEKQREKIKGWLLKLIKETLEG